MVAVRVVRYGVESLHVSPEQVGLLRLGLELMTSQGATSAPGAVRVVREGVEALGTPPRIVALHRLTLEFMALTVTAPGAVRVVNEGVEVLGNVSGTLALHRVTIEFMALAVSAPGAVRIVRYGLEALAPRPPRITARAIPSSYDILAHNWIDTVAMETAWLSDVRQADSVAEERVSLREKPVRQLTVLFTTLSFPSVTKLYAILRRISRELYSIPLFQDITIISQSALAGSSTLIADLTDRRFYAGQNVLAAELGGDEALTGNYEVLTVAVKLQSQIDLDNPTTVDIVANRWVLFPMIDVQRVFETKVEQLDTDAAQVTVKFDESVGPSTLPPMQVGEPDGFPLGHDGVPIFHLDPNWAAPPEVGFLREGETEISGIGSIDAPRGERRRHEESREFTYNRTEFFSLLRFFDTRRGRTRRFWSVDLEDTWTLASLSTNFIDINPVGDFADFFEELFGGYIGLLMIDGVLPAGYTRAVTNVTQVGTLWRVTVSTTLPALVASQVKRVARARHSRFKDDALPEAWSHADVVTTAVNIIELLEEEEVLT